MFSRFFKGETECPFEEDSIECLFWGCERSLSEWDEERKRKAKEEFRSYLSEGKVWPEACNVESRPFEDRASLFWIAADYSMHAPMSCELLKETDWEKYFS